MLKRGLPPVCCHASHGCQWANVTHVAEHVDHLQHMLLSMCSLCSCLHPCPAVRAAVIVNGQTVSRSHDAKHLLCQRERVLPVLPLSKTYLKLGWPELLQLATAMALGSSQTWLGSTTRSTCTPRKRHCENVNITVSLRGLQSIHQSAAALMRDPLAYIEAGRVIPGHCHANYLYSKYTFRFLKLQLGRLDQDPGNH